MLLLHEHSKSQAGSNISLVALASSPCLESARLCACVRVCACACIRVGTGSALVLMLACVPILELAGAASLLSHNDAVPLADAEAV